MLAEHYFAPEDQWSLRITPAHQQLERFFEIWTRTEAELKMRGVGARGEDFRSLFDPETGLVRSFEPAPGYSAALALERQPNDLACFQWVK